jgi:hypothetical protein
MPDNWGFVAAAYAVAAAILGGYWRMLVRGERALTVPTRTEPTAGAGAGARDDRRSRSHQPPETGHPRPEPASRLPRQP